MQESERGMAHNDMWDLLLYLTSQLELTTCIGIVFTKWSGTFNSKRLVSDTEFLLSLKTFMSAYLIKVLVPILPSILYIKHILLHSDLFSPIYPA